MPPLNFSHTYKHKNEKKIRDPHRIYSLGSSRSHHWSEKKKKKKKKKKEKRKKKKKKKKKKEKKKEKKKPEVMKNKLTFLVAKEPLEEIYSQIHPVIAEISKLTS